MACVDCPIEKLAPPLDADFEKTMAQARDFARNEYMPAQVTFRVTRRGYLPELLASLVPSDLVAAAWANTKSRCLMRCPRSGASS